MSKIRRPRHDPGKMKQMVIDFEKSSVSQKDYCAEQGISLAVFAYWKKKLLAVDQGLEPGFRLINQKQPSFQVELTYPNGVRLSSPQGFDTSTLHVLINLW